MNSLQLVTFYGVPGAALLFFARAAKASADTSINLLLLVVSLGVGALLVEIVLSVRPPPRQFEGVAAELGSPDGRTKFEAVRDLRVEGVHGFPAISPWTVRGWSQQPDAPTAITTAPARSTVVACDEGEGWLSYESDAHGFRSYAANPKDSATRIAVVGDSFVFGHCVDDDETVAGRLTARWPSTRNLGVSGSGPLHQLALLREYGPVFEPEVVVWFFYEGNDLGDLQEELRWPAFSAYLDPTYRLGIPERQREIDEWLAVRLDEAYEAELAATDDVAATRSRGLGGVLWDAVKLTSLRRALYFGVTFPSAEPLMSLPEILGTGRETVAGWGGRLVMVYLPAYRRYQPLGDQLFQGREEYIELASSLDVPVVDLADAFQRSSEDPRTLWSHPRGHLNRRGYRLAAESLEEALTKLLN